MQVDVNSVDNVNFPVPTTPCIFKITLIGWWGTRRVANASVPNVNFSVPATPGILLIIVL